MKFDLNKCTSDCLACIKKYAKKHKLSKGQKFSLACKGIKKEVLPDDLLDQLDEEEINAARVLLDPVSWAAEYLDWHCLDPDGSIWKRKNPDEYYKWMAENPGTPILGKSRYHRPYQAAMLRCTSQYRVSRIGRQAGKTESLCVLMLFSLITNKDFKIVLLTPYQTQIEEIFTRLERLIRDGKDNIGNSVKRNVKAPNYQIVLHNGSYVRGFTAGTKSGGNADSVRGQPANLLVFDEADYLNGKDIDSAMSVVTNYPDAVVWMSSTPQGRRDRFFNTCHNPQYKEFHFPSSVNPMWSDKQEAFFRGSLSEIGYKHEAEAEFGEQEEGVFQNAYVDRAQSDYTYHMCKKQPGWYYMIGVDWNDTRNGTAITVTGFDPVNNTFYKVQDELIQKANATQLTAMEKIVELNRLWEPLYIYVDRGYGATQIEMLHDYSWRMTRERKHGLRHPDYRLKDIVIPYDFASKIEINDPFTGQPVKKDAKPFLVENTVRRFERGDVKFSSHDTDLVKQLQSYIVSKVSVQGKPVYKPLDDIIGDHKLDAFMLSLIGFTLKNSLFGEDNRPVPSIGITGRIGEKAHAIAERAGRENVESRMPANQKRATQTGHKQDKEPTSGRMRYTENTAIFSSSRIPAYHTSANKGRRLWTWPGWQSDAPKPRYRLYGGLAGKKGGRPSRSKI